MAKPTVKRAKRGATKTKKFADDDGEDGKAPAAKPQLTNAYVPNIKKPVT